MSADDPNNKIRQGWQKYKRSAICRPSLTDYRPLFLTVPVPFCLIEEAKRSSLKCQRRNMDNEGSMMARWKSWGVPRHDFRQLCTKCILFLIRPTRLFLFGQ